MTTLVLMMQESVDPDLRKNIAKALQALIEKHGGRRSELVERYGMHKSQISNVINRGLAPRIEMLVQIRAGLGWSLDEICGLEPLHREAERYLAQQKKEVVPPPPKPTTLPPTGNSRSIPQEGVTRPTTMQPTGERRASNKRQKRSSR